MQYISVIHLHSTTLCPSHLILPFQQWRACSDSCHFRTKKVSYIYINQEFIVSPKYQREVSLCVSQQLTKTCHTYIFLPMRQDLFPLLAGFYAFDQICLFSRLEFNYFCTTDILAPQLFTSHYLFVCNQINNYIQADTRHKSGAW